MTWQTDPITDKQIAFLQRLGAFDMPRTKGEASRLIDNILRKPKRTTLRVYDPTDAKTLIDEAAIRVKEELNAFETSQHYRPPADKPASPRFRVVGLEWETPADPGRSGQMYCPLSEARGVQTEIRHLEAEATSTETLPHRGQDVAGAGHRPSRARHDHTTLNQGT
jgi:hypothetical protein